MPLITAVHRATECGGAIVMKDWADVLVVILTNGTQLIGDKFLRINDSLCKLAANLAVNRLMNDDSVYK